MLNDVLHSIKPKVQPPKHLNPINTKEATLRGMRRFAHNCAVKSTFHIPIFKGTSWGRRHQWCTFTSARYRVVASAFDDAVQITKYECLLSNWIGQDGRAEMKLTLA
jgi:hypothetical protein